VLTSDAVRPGDPKRSDEVLQLAKDVQQEYRNRREKGLVPDEKLLSLAEELNAYGMQLKHAPGGFLEAGKRRVLALAASPPEMATVAERSELMDSATLDLARGPVHGVYSAGRSVANLPLDVADWAGLNAGVRVPELPETLKPQTVFGRGVGEVTQFAVGFKGADKVLKGLRYGEASSWAGATLRTGVQTGLTGFAAFDGTNEWRVSNFVQQQAPNPVTGFLEAKRDDSALAGRLKNGVEGMLFGTAFETARLAMGKVAEAVKTGQERQNFTWLFEAVENEVPDLKNPNVMKYLRENTQFLTPDGLPASSSGNVAGGAFTVPYNGEAWPTALFKPTNPEALKAGDVWYIHSIAVKPEYQGKGFASKLLNQIIVDAREAGYRNLTLEAFEDNAAARTLYIRKGFKDVSKWEETPDGVAPWKDGALGRAFYYMQRSSGR
jgi:ribosomal protein S18 acetylase RimI-like enzyme